MNKASLVMAVATTLVAAAAGCRQIVGVPDVSYSADAGVDVNAPAYTALAKAGATVLKMAVTSDTIFVLSDAALSSCPRANCTALTALQLVGGTPVDFAVAGDTLIYLTTSTSDPLPDGGTPSPTTIFASRLDGTDAHAFYNGDNVGVPEPGAASVPHHLAFDGTTAVWLGPRGDVFACPVSSACSQPRSIYKPLQDGTPSSSVFLVGSSVAFVYSSPIAKVPSLFGCDLTTGCASTPDVWLRDASDAVFEPKGGRLFFARAASFGYFDVTGAPTSYSASQSYFVVGGDGSSIALVNGPTGSASEPSVLFARGLGLSDSLVPVVSAKGSFVQVVVDGKDLFFAVNEDQSGVLGRASRPF